MRSPRCANMSAILFAEAAWRARAMAISGPWKPVGFARVFRTNDFAPHNRRPPRITRKVTAERGHGLRECRRKRLGTCPRLSAERGHCLRPSPLRIRPVPGLLRRGDIACGLLRFASVLSPAFCGEGMRFGGANSPLTRANPLRDRVDGGVAPSLRGSAFPRSGGVVGSCRPE